MPLFGIEPDKGITGFHLDPAHLIRHIDPSLGLEELGCVKLGLVVWHVVKHVEEYGVWECFDSGFGETFRLTHIVALRDSNVDLEAIIVIRIIQILPMLADWA